MLRFPNLDVSILYDGGMAPLSLTFVAGGITTTFTAHENPMLLEEIYNNIAKCENTVSNA